MQGINCESTWPGLMEKFGGRVLCYLNPHLSFNNCCTVYAFYMASVTLKQFNKGGFHCAICLQVSFSGQQL